MILHNTLQRILISGCLAQRTGSVACLGFASLMENPEEDAAWAQLKDWLRRRAEGPSNKDKRDFVTPGKAGGGEDFLEFLLRLELRLVLELAILGGIHIGIRDAFCGFLFGRRPGWLAGPVVCMRLRCGRCDPGAII